MTGLGGRSGRPPTDPDEPLYVMGDPEGHPFCLLVG
ncbi:MAG: VOC family protein [Brachybacterium sp.]